nr:MAG TPA: hypothetical protein [Caudoviricetes sp.]
MSNTGFSRFTPHNPQAEKRFAGFFCVLNLIFQNFLLFKINKILP